MPGDKRAWTMAGGLPLLAALVPDGFSVTVIDESVEEIDFEDVGKFDVVGLTGMIVQRDRMLQILKKLKKLPCKVVVGGPYVSIDEDFFDGLCDTIFVGEADTTWPAYLDSVSHGRETHHRYEQKTPTDMTTVPPARLDVLKHQHYMSASMQYSRGCPFTCEFCDIIVIFGRRPRVKTPKQVLAELEGIRRAGFKICFMVDDNFIGNKVAVKKLLPEIIAWQIEHDYPLILSTEATLNLADDPELMDLMYQANFREVFIGIESPRPASLEETKKLQNLRGDTMSEKLCRIRDAGLVVSAGFIVGFDEDDAQIFDEQTKFIEDNHLGQVSLGILMALPKTPLYDRLLAEERLVDDGHVCNFKPKQLTRDQLVDGCSEVLAKLYSADAFFGRIRRNASVSPSFMQKRSAIIAKSANGNGGLKRKLAASSGVAVMGFRLGREAWKQGIFWRALGMYWRQYLRQNWSSGTQRLPLSTFLSLCILHWHHFRLTQMNETSTASSLNYFGAAPVTPAKTVPSNELNKG